MAKKRVQNTILKHAIYRLEHNDDGGSSRIQTYVLPRLQYGITAFLWASFGTFFRYRVHAAISEVCPAGLLSAFGGKRRRNIITLGQYTHISFKNIKVIFFYKMKTSYCWPLMSSGFSWTTF